MPSAMEPPPPHDQAYASGSEEYRRRILQGAMRSIARHGLERSTIASVAREAGVSRQTVYAYYAKREDLLRDAVTRSAIELTEAAVAQARRSATASEFLVELSLGVFYGVREHPAVSATLFAVESPEGRKLTMSQPIQDVVASALAPLVDYDRQLEGRLGVLGETLLRLQVSLLTFPSERTATPEQLRAYLMDVLGPLVN